MVQGHSWEAFIWFYRPAPLVVRMPDEKRKLKGSGGPRFCVVSGPGSSGDDCKAEAGIRALKRREVKRRGCEELF